jgi:methyl-accepting chemotaxis protein
MVIFKRMKLKQRFLLNILTMVVLVMVSLIGVISYNVRKVTMEESQKLVTEITKTEAAKIDNIIENSINVTSSLATIFGNMRLFNQSTRESLISMLSSTLQNNNELLGVWSIWEKDALDSRDMEYVNKPGHDSTGRFVAYYHRDNGAPVLDSCVDYQTDNENGAYYFKPFKSGRVTIVGPFDYNLGNKKVTMISVCHPIKVNGITVGVVGVDITLDTLIDHIKNLTILGTGTAILFTNDGTIVASKNPDLIGKNISSLPQIKDKELIIENIKKGKEFTLLDYSITLKDNTYKIHIPLTFHNKDIAAWSLATTVPVTTMMEESRRITILIIITSIIGLLIIGTLVYFFTDKIVTPIKKVADSLKQISNLDYSENIYIQYTSNREDEITMMIESLTEVKETIIKLLSLLKTKSKDLSSSSQTLAAISEESVASIEEIKASIDKVKQLTDDNLEGTKNLLLIIFP